MYRIGKKQKRAILTADGNEVVVFPKGKEALAEKVCNLLNAELEGNKISSNGMLAVSLPSRSDILIKSKEYEGGTEMNDRYRRIGFQDGMETMKTIIELQMRRRQ